MIQYIFFNNHRLLCGQWIVVGGCKKVVTITWLEMMVAEEIEVDR